MRNHLVCLRSFLLAIAWCLPLIASPPQAQPDATTVAIDANWLKERGAGPYLLDQARTTYVLQTDVTTAATAFVVVAPDVTLDLNGHVITYGNAAPIALTNGGFEEGSDRTVPGWDLRQAATARIADNTSFLFGKQVLRLSSFTEPQIVISDPVAITSKGRAHTAMITPANTKANCSLSLTVVDATTGKKLGTGKSASASRGFSAVVHFTPTTTNPVRLHVEVTPKPGMTGSLDLDEASITVSGDCGVLASRTWSGELLGLPSLPPYIQAAYKAKRVANVTVRNGKILQGLAAGFASPPFFCHHLPGLKIEQVETLAHGTDTCTVEATGASDSVTIRECTFREAINNITHRMHGPATLKLTNVQGTIVVEDNRLLGCPQVGILLARNDPRFPVKICRNVIRQNARVTNGYAILCSAVQNFAILDNQIQPVNGRGIDLDSYTGDVLGQGEIRGNTVEVQERPNREYPTGLDATALRLRNVADKGGIQQNLLIRANHFQAKCGPGLSKQAFAVRISYTNEENKLAQANVRLVGNTFRALADSSDPGYKARALVLDKVEAGVDLHLVDNKLESNDVCVALGDSGGGVDGVTLAGNTFRRWTESASREFTAIQAGYYTRNVRDVRFLACPCEGFADLTVVWAGTGMREVLVGEWLDVRVVDASGDALADAEITVRGADDKLYHTCKTDAEGRARVAILTTVHRPGKTKRSSGEKLPAPMLEVNAGTRSQKQPAALGKEMTIRLR